MRSWPGRGVGWTIAGLFAVMLFVALIVVASLYGIILGMGSFGS